MPHDSGASERGGAQRLPLNPVPLQRPAQPCTAARQDRGQPPSAVPIALHASFAASFSCHKQPHGACVPLVPTCFYWQTLPFCFSSVKLHLSFARHELFTGQPSSTKVTDLSQEDLTESPLFRQGSEALSKQLTPAPLCNGCSLCCPPNRSDD